MRYISASSNTPVNLAVMLPSGNTYADPTTAQPGVDNLVYKTTGLAASPTFDHIISPLSLSQGVSQISSAGQTLATAVTGNGGGSSWLFFIILAALVYHYRKG